MSITSALSLLLVSFVSLPGQADSLTAEEARWFDVTARDCSGGVAAQCEARRAQIASGAFHPGGPGLAQGGPLDKLSASKVLGWIERVRTKLAGLGVGLGQFIEKAGALLNVLEANGGDIKRALASGQLLPLAQEALGLAKGFIVSHGLGDGHLIDKIQTELPQLASQLESNHLSVGGVLEKLKQDFEGGNSPLHALAGSSPPHGPPSTAATLSLAAEKFNSRLQTLLPP